MAITSFQSKNNLVKILELYNKDYSLFLTNLSEIELRKKEKHKLFINLVSSEKSENQIIESLSYFSDKQKFSLINRALMRECLINISVIQPKVFEFISQQNKHFINNKIFFKEEFSNSKIKNNNDIDYTINFNKGISDKYEYTSYIYSVSSYYSGSFVSNLSEYILNNVSLIKTILLYDNNLSSLNMLFQAKDKSINSLFQAFKELEDEGKMDYTSLINYIKDPRHKDIDSSLINYILSQDSNLQNPMKLINDSIKEYNFSHFEALTNKDSIYYHLINANSLFDNFKKAFFLDMSGYYKENPHRSTPTDFKQFYTQGYHSLLENYPELIEHSFFSDSKKLNNFISLANYFDCKEIASTIEIIYLENTVKDKLNKSILNVSKKRL